MSAFSIDAVGLTEGTKAGASGRSTGGFVEVGLASLDVRSADLVDVFLINRFLEARLLVLFFDGVEMVRELYIRQTLQSWSSQSITFGDR